jgi:ABC-2 type transport system permease protein
MSLTRIYAVFLRYMYLLRGNPQRLVTIFIWVLLDIILWGFLTRYLNEVGNAGFSFVPVLLGAIILSDFLSRVQQGVSMPFLEDVWAHNLLNYFASPLRIQEYLAGLIGASIVTSTLGLFAMVILAFLIFGFSIVQFGATLIGFLLILFFFGIALGIVGAAIVLRLGPSGEWFVWPLVTAITPFIGVFYPVSVLPTWMQIVSKFLPPSYVFETARGLILQISVPSANIFVGIMLSLLYIALAYVVFLAIYKSAVKSGAIMRYSAEGDT